jgi:hypothetical protein
MCGVFIWGRDSRWVDAGFGRGAPLPRSEIRYTWLTVRLFRRCASGSVVRHFTNHREPDEPRIQELPQRLPGRGGKLGCEELLGAIGWLSALISIA